MNKDLKQRSRVKSEISPADGKPMLSEVLLLKLDEWIQDCKEQQENFLINGMEISAYGSESMGDAYKVVRTFIKDFR